MKHKLLAGLLMLFMAAPGLFAQSDAVNISEYLPIERSDARQWIERYQSDIDRYIDENRNVGDYYCDALFIGSSSINMWNTLHEDMAPMKIVRRSYGGATIRDMLYNYDVIARGYDPSCIVMYVENDFCSCNEGISEYETFDLFRVFTQRIRRDYPGVPFYIISFKPSFSRQEQLGQQQVINHLLKVYAENTPDVEFIDITQAMYDSNGKLREDIFLDDRLHLNDKGYEIWTSIIKPKIMKHIRGNIYSYQVGDYTLSLLSEGQGRANQRILLEATPEMKARLIPDGTFANAVNAFLLRTPEGKYILIDTGFGRELFNNLEALNVKPEDIATILLTHTHGDHISGLLRDGKVAFPNAELLLSRQELEFWMKSDNPQSNAMREAYRIKTFEVTDISEAKLNNENSIQYIEAFGHTPGHTAFLISSQGERMLVWGDLTHAMPIQMPHPEIAVTYDSDPDTAIQSRLKIMEFIAGKKIPVAGMHIPYPAMGTIKANGQGGYYYKAINL